MNLDTEESAVPVPRPCLDCQVHYAKAGGSRCPECEAKRNGARPRLSAHGNGARQRMRRQVNANGVAVCAVCHSHRAASQVEIDHLVPLADGGADIDANVRPVCLDCHRVKSARENRVRAGRR